MNYLMTLLLIFTCLTTSSCYRSSNSNAVGTDAKKNTSDKPLSGLAEVARSFGNQVPANEDMVRLMKLTTADGGKYYIWQLGVSPKDNDIRVINVSDKDAGVIILSRVNTHPQAFERYSHLTNTAGELHSTVYTSYGSREQRVIGPDDPAYQKALDDFKAQVVFWTSREQEIKARFPAGAPRQTPGEWLELR